MFSRYPGSIRVFSGWTLEPPPDQGRKLPTRHAEWSVEKDPAEWGIPGAIPSSAFVPTHPGDREEQRSDGADEREHHATAYEVADGPLRQSR